MEITSSHKGQSVKTANVKMDDATTTTAHDKAARFAMKHFGETPDRLMGWDTDRASDPGNVITVRLYTS